MDKSTALNIFAVCHINSDRDFFTLRADEVGSLLDFADKHKYRKPRNANGSRGRYFHAYLKRAINRK